MTGTKPMIENSDRGLTITKSLAWTLVAGLLSAGLWVGATVSEIDNRTETLGVNLKVFADRAERDVSASLSARGSLDARLRVLENSSARQEAQFQSMTDAMNELRTALRETNTLLQQVNRRDR